MARQSKGKDEISNFEEFTRGLAERIAIQAVRPNIHGYIPHDKQVLFHNAPKRHRLYIGGNRSGKTTGGIAEDIWWLTGRHPYRRIPEGGIRGRIVGVDFVNGIEKILLPEFKRWCPVADLRGGSWSSAWDTQERTLHFENGSFVEFMSYDQDVDKFAGTSRHFIHFDEEPPLDIYIECIARLVDTGGSWWMTLTPVMGMQWMYDDIYIPGTQNPNSEISVIEVEMYENPHLGAAEIQSFLESLPEEDRDARVKGKFQRRGGVIFKSYSASTHIIDDFELPPAGIGEVYASLDHGFNNPTAWLWHYISPDGDIVTFNEHYESEMIIEDHVQHVKLFNMAHKRDPIIYVGDPAIAQHTGVTKDSVQSQYANFGIGVMLGNNDVTVGIAKMNSYLQRGRWKITRNCENLLKEMPKYRWRTWANKKAERDNNPYDIPHKKNDHAIDSCRYMFTLMPDLTPMKIELDKPIDPPVAEMYEAIKRRPVFDRNAAKAPTVNGDWHVEHVDQYMGGEW